MARFLILFIAVFLFVACGTKTVELGNPDFPDNNAAADDDNTLSDSDSQIDPDGDSNIPDSDSAIDPDDDTTLPDNDSVIDPDDDSTVIPDDDIVTECTIGEKKCDDTLDNVLECNVSHEWISVEDCSAPLKMCVENPADNFFCEDLVCEPGVKFCKNEDLYTCNTDGQGDTLAQNCSDTQYCNTVSLTCEDMVCDPDQLFCDGNVLKTCNGNGSDSTVSKDCGTGICDEVLENCVYTNEVGGTSSFDRTGQRGNFFDCNKNVKVVEFAQELEYTGSKDLSWAIYEAEGSSTTYNRIFIKNESTTGTGKAYYSTGAISVNLVSGKKYIFATAWNGTVKVYYGNNPASNDPILTGFGSTKAAHSVNSTIFPETYTNPTRYEVVFNQQIKFME